MVPVYKLASEAQHLWGLAEFLECLYPTTERHKRRQKLHAVWGDILDCHRTLWPQVAPCQLQTIDIVGEGSFVNAISTSLVFATCIWGWTAPKRSVESKLLSAKFLKGLFCLAYKFEDGFAVEFLRLEEDGTGLPCQQTIGRDGCVDCWTSSMSNAVAALWDRAVLDHAQAYPSSPRDHTLLHDFVLWSLQPVPQNHKERHLKHYRALLSVPALTIVTHVAKFIETQFVPWLMKELDAEPLEDRPFRIQTTTGTKRRRTSSMTVNFVCAKAAQKLFTGTEPLLNFDKRAQL